MIVRLASALWCAAVLVVGCSLGPDAVFGAPCFAAADCPSPYSCVDGQCISEGEGEGEGEGEEPLPTCGNDTVDEAETCDDGNILPGDGCSPQCVVEDGFTCLSPGRCAALETSDPCPDDDGADLTGDCRADFVVAGTTVVAVFVDVDTGGGTRDWQATTAAVETATTLGQLRHEALPGPDARRAVLFGLPERTQIVARTCVGDPCLFDRDHDAIVERQVVGFPGVYASLPAPTLVEGGLVVAVRDDIRVGPGQGGPETNTSFGLDVTTDVDLPVGVTPTALHVVPDRTSDGVSDIIVVHDAGIIVIDGLSLSTVRTSDRVVRLLAPARDANLIVVDEAGVQLIDDAFSVLLDITTPFPVGEIAAVTSVRDASGDGVDDVLLGVPAQGAVVLAPTSDGVGLVCGPTLPAASEFGASLRSLGVYEGAAAAVIGAPGVAAVELRSFAIVDGACGAVVLGAKSVDAAVAPRFGSQLAH